MFSVLPESENILLDCKKISLNASIMKHHINTGNSSYLIECKEIENHLEKDSIQVSLESHCCADIKVKQKVSPMTATAGSDVVQSGRPIFDDFFQHLWPYIGNNTANVVLQMVKRLWLIRIDQ
ncbi:hypothetical protein TNCV_5061661 [Trichonephila clavipes]|nr:hypothetical protein TNCV_5061661 [Trichonephila clavipes]